MPKKNSPLKGHRCIDKAGMYIYTTTLLTASGSFTTPSPIILACTFGISFFQLVAVITDIFRCRVHGTCSGSDNHFTIVNEITEEIRTLDNCINNNYACYSET